MQVSPELAIVGGGLGSGRPLATVFKRVEVEKRAWRQLDDGNRLQSYVSLEIWAVHDAMLVQQTCLLLQHVVSSSSYG